jgi:aryl-alcohol dehydrogenase-like predicted oxidoreductase
MPVDRRSFLRSLAALTAGWLLPEGASGAAPREERDRIGLLLPRRPLGATGESVTMLGVGGWHAGEMPERDAQSVIEIAIEGGVRFFDTAASYQGGGSETRYGRLLVPKYRDAIFLMTKTAARAKADARKDLEESLRRLRTDRLDLWQIHAINSPGDVDDRIAGGVLDVLLDARRTGKARHIGFTGHLAPEAHRRMLARTDALETCQMPVNVLDPSYRSFVSGVMPELVRRRTGVIAMKTLANGGLFGAPDNRPAIMPIAIPERISLAQALHFVWSLPVSVLVTGVNGPGQMSEKISIARSFRMLDAAARRALVNRVADLAGPQLEYYKA